MGCISELIRNVSSGKRQIDVQPTVKVVVVPAVISIAAAMPMMHLWAPMTATMSMINHAETEKYTFYVSVDRVRSQNQCADKVK